MQSNITKSNIVLSCPGSPLFSSNTFFVYSRFSLAIDFRESRFCVFSISVFLSLIKKSVGSLEANRCFEKVFIKRHNKRKNEIKINTFLIALFILNSYITNLSIFDVNISSLPPNLNSVTLKYHLVNYTVTSLCLTAFYYYLLACTLIFWQFQESLF